MRSRVVATMIVFVVFGAGPSACERDAPVSAPPPNDAGDAPTEAPTLREWDRYDPHFADRAPQASHLVEPEALAELAKAVPTSRLGPTGPRGTSLVGTETKQPDDDGQDEGASSDATAAGGPHIQGGVVESQPGLSSDALEEAMRAELYWPLTQRCRTESGGILPPDAVTLQFELRADGAISIPTISVTASNAEHAEAARCMRRELAASTFRGPAAARGASTLVTATVPSVD